MEFKRHSSTKQVHDVAAPAQSEPAKPGVETGAMKHDDAGMHSPKDEVSTGGKQSDAPAVEVPEKVTATVQQNHTGTGGVVFAAVVVILGLGAMMTYAYLRSQNISLF